VNGTATAVPVTSPQHTAATARRRTQPRAAEASVRAPSGASSFVQHLFIGDLGAGVQLVRRGYNSQLSYNRFRTKHRTFSKTVFPSRTGPIQPPRREQISPGSRDDHSGRGNWFRASTS
jgi:hypothetical protein